MITQETLNQVEHQVMFVTPEMAQEWLLQNTNNRKRSNAATKRWADAMRANVWELSSDAIAFDVNGVLINGQHRLMAVITTGTTQPFLVCRNFPAKSVNALDVGKKRDLSAIITISGHQISQTHAAVCRHLLTPWHQSTLFNADHELHRRKIISLHTDLEPKINFVESVIKTKEFTSPELAAFVSAHADLDDEDFIVNLINLIMHGIRVNNTREPGDEAALRYRDYRLTTRAKGKRNTGMGAFKLLSSVAYKCATEEPVKRIVMLGSNPFKNYAEHN